MKIPDAQGTPGSDHGSGPGPVHSEAGRDQPHGSDENGSPGSSDGVLQILVRFVEQVAGSANGLIEIYADRLRLSVRRTIVQVVLGTAAAICAAVWLGAASLSVFRGICGGLAAAWGGRAWLGDLTGGLLALTLAACAMALHRVVASRRELRRLEAKYERIRNEHEKHLDKSGSAGDSASAARSRGSAGDPAHRGVGATAG